jgi:hypothetical protein
MSQEQAGCSLNYRQLWQDVSISPLDTQSVAGFNSIANHGIKAEEESLQIEEEFQDMVEEMKKFLDNAVSQVSSHGLRNHLSFENKFMITYTLFQLNGAYGTVKELAETIQAETARRNETPTVNMKVPTHLVDQFTEHVEEFYKTGEPAFHAAALPTPEGTQAQGTAERNPEEGTTAPDTSVNTRVTRASQKKRTADAESSSETSKRSKH